MSRNLVIVESPAKAKTIKRFLGKDFIVEASMGHIRDLPSGGLSVDTDHFVATYEISEDKKHVVKKLQKELDTADELWIATDEDREGEAIGWHLTEVLKRKKKQPVRRIVFHEITESALKEAAEHPRDLDEKLVEAQQARRILDRLVGYTLSPFLWKKVYRGLSAGRVQSVAVRLIVDRERAIRAFVPKEYWTIAALLQTEAREEFIAELKKRDGKPYIPVTGEQASAVKNDVEGKPFTVSSLEEKTLQRTPPPPFTTSTLQQEGSRKLGFSVKQTMVVAQQLYEGIDLGKGQGQTGLITYMRTDSVHLSDHAVEDITRAVEKNYGREYILSTPRRHKTKSKGAQEAHEAIRPTEMANTPESLRSVLDSQQLKLYTLVWNRTIATQMAAAQLKRIGADIAADRYTFRATGQTVVFDGYFRVYSEGRDEPEESARKEEEESDDEKRLPPLKEGQKLSPQEITPEQHFTKAPPRYTEASLVKKLEEEGIGRPSTYAPTISTIQQRGYIKKEDKQLVPEDIAFTVIDLLKEHFSEIVDIAFTATMEQDLDEIAEGSKQREQFLRSFFQPFSEKLKEKSTEVQREDILKERVLGDDPATGLPVLVRTGRFGPYVQLGRLEDMPELGATKKGKAGDPERSRRVKREKPKSASIPKDRNRDEITLEDGLALLSFPRFLGESGGETVEVHRGRFGPYLKCGAVTVTLPPSSDPLRCTLEEAKDLLVHAKERKAREAAPLKELGKDPNTGGEILVKTGRYGPYVTDGTTNASVPKNLDPYSIDMQKAIDLLERKRVAPKRKWKGRGKKSN